jgi:hypothetical protein
MLLQKKHNILIFMFFISFISFSQEIEKKEEAKPMPISIYTQFTNTINLNSAYAINQKLQLTSPQFMFFNSQAIDEGTFNIPFYNINESPTNYIFNAYHQNFVKQPF